MKKCHQKMDSLMKKYYCVDCGIKITYGHLRTNFNRDYWYAHCTYLMENR
jgi:hypothetical protein